MNIVRTDLELVVGVEESGHHEVQQGPQLSHRVLNKNDVLFRDIKSCTLPASVQPKLVFEQEEDDLSELVFNRVEDDLPELVF